ncbi:MAG TPA: AraC family transcriptional regulator, partial [Rectinemataceae bacterium]|nr:AraC family transcriptional regulator [Rectinemataceae bacterium]
SFRETLRYKTKAMVGPLVAGRCLVLLPLREASGASESRELLLGILGSAFRRELAHGYLRLGFGPGKPLEEAASSWAAALAELLGVGEATGQAGGVQADAKPFDDDEAFLEALIGGAPERAGLALDRILEELGPLPVLPAAERYRMISLFGSALRALTRRGFIDRGEAAAMMDLEDLRQAGEGQAFTLAVRSRFHRLSGVMASSPRLTPPVSKAVAFVKENYGRQLSLELAADAVGLSPNRLSRLFVEETGHGFSDFLIEYRIERAKELLALPGASIKQVSISCGYPDPNYFSRLFKKVTGLTPTAFSSGSTEVSDEKS